MSKVYDINPRDYEKPDNVLWPVGSQMVVKRPNFYQGHTCEVLKHIGGMNYCKSTKGFHFMAAGGNLELDL